MKCAQIKQWLPEMAGGELGSRERGLCEAHLSTCAACREELAQLERAVRLLRDVGPAEEARLPAGFALALHRRLVAEPPPVRPLAARVWDVLERLGLGMTSPGRAFGLAGAVAACALLVALALPRGGPPRPVLPEEAVAEVVAPVQVPTRRVAVVHFDFVTDMVVDEVTFEVSVPPELAFVSEGKPLSERTLRWSGSLSVGSNPVPLAVTGARPGRYKIEARARGQGVDVRHDVVLEVVSS